MQFRTGLNYTGKKITSQNTNKTATLLICSSDYSRCNDYDFLYDLSGILAFFSNLYLDHEKKRRNYN